MADDQFIGALIAGTAKSMGVDPSSLSIGALTIDEKRRLMKGR